MRPKAFFINGGSGRVLCSIPALEKYNEEISEDFIVVCEGGQDMFKGHPVLHKKAFDVYHKALFEERLINHDIVSLEPYRIWEYYNQKCSLAQAFDIEINNKGIRDLAAPSLHLSSSEKIQGKLVIDEVKEKTQKDKIIVIQPFGRGVQAMKNYIVDYTGRSFEYQNLVNFIKKLSSDFGIIVMSELEINFEKEGVKQPVAQPRDVDLRHWAGIINSSDYFLGCDSVGQHIAYSLDKPTTVIVGSTFAENVSYPDHNKVDIQDMGEGKRVYDPIRIVPDDVVNRNNDGIMRMNSAIEDVIVKSIHKNYKKHTNDVKNKAQNVLNTPQKKQTETPDSEIKVVESVTKREN